LGVIAIKYNLIKTQYMEENESFLKYLIDEEIYIIEDKSSIDTINVSGFADDKIIKDSYVEKSKHIPDVINNAKVAAGTDKKGEANGSGDKDPSPGGSGLVEADDSPGGSGSVDVDDFSDVDSSGEGKETKRYRNTTVLILDCDDKTSISPEHKDLLAKILHSVNLNLDSVEMVFRAEYDKLSVKSFINCPVIAFLPLIPKHINALFAAEKYMINIINGNHFVACNTLNELRGDRSLKRKLWEQLKLIYGI
jgi:DNA polymerase III psi subunit